MIKRNPFIKLLFFIVLASLLNSCANLNKLPKHNTPLIKDDIRTLGKKRMEETLEIGPVPVFGDTTKLKKRKNISSETVKNYLIIPNEYKKLKQNISFKFYNTPIKDVMILMSRLGGINILVGDEVSGTITANLSNIPWDRSFQAILDMKGYASDIDVENNLIRIQLPGTLTSQDSYYSQRALAIKQKVEVENSIDPILSEIFRLYYLSPADAKKTLLSVFREKSGSSSTIQITEENTTRSIIIRGTNKDLNIVEKIIKEIDKRTQQVLIEAFIVEASSEFERALGTSLGGRYSNNASDAAAGAIGTTSTALDGTSAALGSATDKLTNFGATGATSGIGLIRRTSSAVIKAEITALEKLGMVRQISNPKIFTLNNQVANVVQGTNIPYEAGGEAGGVSFAKADLSLTVTPSIVGDGNVLLDIIVTNNSAGTPVEGNIPINTMEIVTKLLVADGDVVVIGGIKKAFDSETKNQTPGIGNVPVIGNLFKGKAEKDTLNELLVFIAPRIL